MSRGRIAFMSRRFWPLVGGVETALADLAVGLREQDFHLTVVTPRWRTDWPEQFQFDGASVVRLAAPTKSWWGQRAFNRRFAHWLKQNRDQIDLLAVSEDKHCGDVVAIGKRQGLPVVLLAEQRTPTLLPRTKRLLRTSLPLADVVVVSHQDHMEAWRQAGYPVSHVREIALGVRPSSQDSRQKRQVRQALGRAIGDAKVSENAPLAVCFQKLDDLEQLSPLLLAWKEIVKRYPGARLWVFGSGSQRGALIQHVEQLDLQHRVWFPGVIESVDDLLASADLLIALQNAPVLLLRAMAAGLPVIASDVPHFRRYVSHEETGFILPPADVVTWVTAIDRVLGDPSTAQSLAHAGQQRAQAKFALEKRVEDFARLFEGLICDRDADSP